MTDVTSTCVWQVKRASAAFPFFVFGDCGVETTHEVVERAGGAVLHGGLCEFHAEHWRWTAAAWEKKSGARHTHEPRALAGEVRS